MDSKHALFYVYGGVTSDFIAECWEFEINVQASSLPELFCLIREKLKPMGFTNAGFKYYDNLDVFDEQVQLWQIEIN